MCREQNFIVTAQHSCRFCVRQIFHFAVWQATKFPFDLFIFQFHFVCETASMRSSLHCILVINCYCDLFAFRTECFNCPLILIIAGCHSLDNEIALLFVNSKSRFMQISNIDFPLHTENRDWGIHTELKRTSVSFQRDEQHSKKCGAKGHAISSVRVCVVFASFKETNMRAFHLPIINRKKKKSHTHQTVEN